MSGHTVPDSNAFMFEWCEIRRWRGYATSSFYAVASTGEVLAESPPFRWRKDAPPPETPSSRAAYDAVVATITGDGWTISDEPHNPWFQTRFSRPCLVPPPAQVAPTAGAAPAAPEPAPPVLAHGLPHAPPPPAPPQPPPELAPTPTSPPAFPPPPPAQVLASPPPAPISASPTRQKTRRLAIAGGAAALVAAGVAFVPATLRGNPQPPAAATRTRHVPKKAHHDPPPPTTTTIAASHHQPLVDLRIVAHGNGSWMEIRRQSAHGPVLYRATLASGQKLHFRGARLWALFGAAGNLWITDNGRHVVLSGTPKKVFIP